MATVGNDIQRGLEVVQAIKDQVGRMVLGALGARQYVSYSYGMNVEGTGFVRGGVEFTVAGGHKKAVVLLNAADLYDVRYVSKRTGKVCWEANNVYCEDLAQTLIVGLDAAVNGTKVAA